MADNEDQEDTQGSGSQTYSTPHDQVQLPSSMVQPTAGASSTVDVQPELDPLPPSKRQRVAADSN